MTCDCEQKWALLLRFIVITRFISAFKAIFGGLKPPYLLISGYYAHPGRQRLYYCFTVHLACCENAPVVCEVVLAVMVAHLYKLVQTLLVLFILTHFVKLSGE